MNGDINTNADGSNFWWTVSEIPYNVLALVAADAGFAHFLPKAPEPKAALQAACKLAKTRDARTLLVRDASMVGAEGFVVAHEHADPNDASKPAWTEIFRVTLDAQGEPSAILPIMAPDEDRAVSAAVLLDFKRQLTVAPGALVGRFLTDSIASLGALTLRPTGGIYWLPKGDAVRFENLRALLGPRSNGTVTVYKQNIVTDDDQIATLAGAVAAELDSEISRIQREIQHGIQRGTGYVPLGKRAMDARVSEVGALIQRASRFSTMLGKVVDTARLVAVQGEAEEALAILSA